MHIKMRAAAAAAVAVALLSPVSGFAQSVSFTGLLPVTQIYTGWHSDTWGIGVGGTTPVNPANCPSPDAYYSDGTDPGSKNYYAQALTAFSTGTHVVVVVSNTTCTAGRPTIYGLQLQP
jgi:hypothetical protein